ncbi:MAG: TIGR00366 family protein, partial [Halobacteria archaeon]|nr:TIGR00366 family protein [Halobacteria archaeon]
YSAIILYLLSPPESETEGISHFIPESQLGETEAAADGGEREEVVGEEEPEEETVMADKIDNNRVLGGLIALGGIIITVHTFWTQGLNALNLNTVNFGFLFIGLALFTKPKAYQDQFYEAVSSTAGIILQFPFYAGIMGMMNFSGLSETMATALISISTESTFPIVAWITAGIVNIFVPSGGGEWTVIGSSILEAAKGLGVPLGKATVAYAVGDAHTNLFQPFWAIPLLGITGMRARDVFGYAVTMLLFLIPFLAIALFIVPY